jgi:hypothetical protein
LYGLEGSAIDSIRRAEVLFVGNSRLQGRIFDQGGEGLFQLDVRLFLSWDLATVNEVTEKKRRIAFPYALYSQWTKRERFSLPGLISKATSVA